MTGRLGASGAGESPGNFAVRVAGECLGVIWRTGEQHAGMRRPLGHQDNRAELHAIAHGDHDIAKVVVPRVADRNEVGWSLAGVLWIKGLRCIFGAEAAAGDEEKSNECGSEPGFQGIPY